MFCKDKMAYNLELSAKEVPFRALIKLYMKRAKEIESYLSKRPDEWGKFQSEFNAEVNGVFRNIMNFEKANLASGHEDKVYKLKRLFIDRIRKIFVRGVYTDWSLRKPFGYAGDFKIIDDIYCNNPTTKGFDRLFDNYFQMSAISVAVRNRKEDLKRFITDFVSQRNNAKLKIMDLACGPCRDIKENLTENRILLKNVVFDCYDNDAQAIEFAKDLLKNFYSINFFKENALRIAFRRNINNIIGKKYDIIFSTGLFDYLTERVASRLIESLKKLLNPKGILFIANVRDKYSNPSVHFMEWVGDWNLIYRDDDTFIKIFLEAGFKTNQIKINYEQQGIMQYIYAFNK